MTDIEQDIVRLRTIEKLSMREISRRTGLSQYKVTEILKEELKDKYSSYLEASPEEAQNIIVLRKKGISLKRIKNKYKLSYLRVVTILKKELGDEYSKYSAKYIRMSTLQKKRIARLKKKGYSLNYLMEEFKLNLEPLKRILKEEIGDKYQNYNNKISDDMKKKIVRLSTERYSYEEIAKMTPLSITSVKSILDTFDLIFDEIILKLGWKANPIIKRECNIVYESVHSKIKKFTKYRVASRLAPIIIFLFFRMKGLNINSKDFIKAAEITSKKFRHGLKYVQQSSPHVFVRDHKGIVRNNLNELKLQFGLNSSFSRESILLLERFWPLIQNTKEEIIAAIICIFTMIKLNITLPKYDTICKRLGITMSSTIYQVKHNIFEKSHINHFHGFKKSRTFVEILLRTTI